VCVSLKCYIMKLQLMILRETIHRLSGFEIFSILLVHVLTKRKDFEQCTTVSQTNTISNFNIDPHFVGKVDRILI